MITSDGPRTTPNFTMSQVGGGGNGIGRQLPGNFTTHSRQVRLPAWHCQWVRAPIAGELYHTLMAGLTACDGPRTTPNFTTSWKWRGGNGQGLPWPGNFTTHWSLMTPRSAHCRLPSQDCTYVFFCINIFLNFFKFLSVSLAIYRFHWPLAIMQ